MHDEDGDERDDTFLDSFHQRMLLYRSPLLFSSGRPGRSGGLIALLVVLAGLYLLVVEYWLPILLALLALALLFLVGFAGARPLKPGSPSPHPAAEAATIIRNTIRSTPKLGRYAWSTYDGVLVRQWNHFRETGQTPLRRKTLARKERDAAKRANPDAKPAPLGRQAQAILAEINASPRLARHAWHTHETDLLEQWQRYQSLGQLPIRRSKLERHMARASTPQPGGHRQPARGEDRDSR